MRDTLTHATEDYLKAIYDLNTAGSLVSTSAIATRLVVTPASVTGMLLRLSNTKPPLIIYHKHHGVILTEEGKRAALEVIRHHRLLETYLHENLGYAWDEVHEEACRLEHFISENFEARIAIALGNPLRDPHGDPIPTADLTIPHITDTPLSDLRPPQTGIIRRVRSSNAQLLRHLQSLGLIPGVKVEITVFSTLDSNLHLCIHEKKQDIVLGLPITSQIFVEVIK